MSDQRHWHSNLSGFRAAVPPGTVEPGIVELPARRHQRPRPHYWDNTLVPGDDLAVRGWRSPRTTDGRSDVDRQFTTIGELHRRPAVVNSVVRPTSLTRGA